MQFEQFKKRNVVTLPTDKKNVNPHRLRDGCWNREFMSTKVYVICTFQTHKVFENVVSI